MDNLDSILEEILCSAYNRIIHNEEKILKDLGELTLKEFHTLDCIAHATKNKCNTSASIAKLLSITPSTFTINIDRLAKKGLVEKTRSESDKRVILITLTQYAQGLRKKRELMHKRLINNAISKLSATEKVTLTTTFNKIDI